MKFIHHHYPVFAARLLRVLPGMLILALSFSLGQSATTNLNQDTRLYLTTNYDVARSNYIARSTNAEAAWQMARACFERAENETNPRERAVLATEGIAAARTSIQNLSTNAAGQYYLALNLGQLAQTRTIGALPLISEMERALVICARLAPELDYAGPHRALGIIYRKTPGWPMSVGSKTKSRQHLELAVKLAPDYLGNQLALLEAYADWRETAALTRNMAAYPGAIARAKQVFNGVRWADEWRDWDHRWALLRQRFPESANDASKSATHECMN